MQFAEGMGVKRDEVLSTVYREKTQQMVDEYYDLAETDWRDGLCALYAYEYQVPAISESKIDGLKKFYNITDEKTLAFFSAHQVYDVQHANQVASLIERYVDVDCAEAATQKAAKALWGFLDGMCEAHGIVC